VAATKGGGQRRRGLNSVVVFLLNSAFCTQATNGWWVLPPKSDGNSQEVLPVSGTQISKKRVSYLRVCKHTRQKAPKSSRLTDRQLADRQIWDTLLWGRSKHGKVQQQFSSPGESVIIIKKKNLFSSLFYRGREDIFFDHFN
jgi:hypothetical protein